MSLFFLSFKADVLFLAYWSCFYMINREILGAIFSFIQFDLVSFTFCLIVSQRRLRGSFRCSMGQQYNGCFWTTVWVCFLIWLVGRVYFIITWVRDPFWWGCLFWVRLFRIRCGRWVCWFRLSCCRSGDSNCCFRRVSQRVTGFRVSFTLWKWWVRWFWNGFVRCPIWWLCFPVIYWPSTRWGTWLRFFSPQECTASFLTCAVFVRLASSCYHWDSLPVSSCCPIFTSSSSSLSPPKQCYPPTTDPTSTLSPSPPTTTKSTALSTAGFTGSSKI